jgi:hypothetical protein
VIEPQVVAQRQVLDARAGAPRELADAVDRVVIVGGQHARRLAIERIRLGDQLDRRASRSR